MANGLSLLDLTELPASWRTVMTVALRETCVSFDDLVTAVNALPEVQHIEEAELRQIVDDLADRGYLVQDTSGANDVYRPRVMRRAGRQMSEKLWCALEESGDESAWESKDERPAVPERRPRKSLWDNLG